MGAKDKKKAAAAKKASKAAAKSEVVGAQGEAVEVTAEAIKALRQGDDITVEQQRVAANRAVTGVLASPVAALDIKFEAFTVAVGGQLLVDECKLELSQGCRYGLIGDNGSGKSNVRTESVSSSMSIAWFRCLLPSPSGISRYQII